jgi:hypothetical protein
LDESRRVSAAVAGFMVSAGTVTFVVVLFL